ncbi:GNAT family N-acetyltransferase [Chitinophaga sp.]|uniref:GNAT family N-acetyltransferase n=1 Tax=Chitinophaga sp. TaxID=1869181 RepID=UPI002CD9F6D9|nr:GNAT family N-acetyltransferase [Chitinophaga sp.]HWV68719.1 GNAT family N-acetyltransferase [Chitinophaga sp.]
MRSLPETFPVLFTPRLHLVEIEHLHQPDLFYLLTDKRVTRYYHVIPLNEVADVRPVIDLFKKRFNDKEGIRWGIALENKTELIGFIGFNNYETADTVPLVFALVQEYWGKGYMAEAIESVVQYIFSALEVKQVVADVLPGNAASESVLEKTGFSHEGLVTGGMVWNNKSYDVNRYVRKANL